MNKPTDPTLPDTGVQEKITPFLEGAILELALLAIKLVTTPFAVLFFTKDFREQLKAFHDNELNARYSPTVARPLSFYVLWMAAHFLLANSYWYYIARGRADLRDIASEAQAQVGRLAAFLKDHNWSDLTGRIEALVIIAFAVTMIIAVKAALVTAVARSMRCRIRFATPLYASAYAMGTLVFFQYAFIISHYFADAIFGGSQAHEIGYFVLIYGSLLLCIVLASRVNKIIQVVDETPEVPTFISWLVGTTVWLYLIILGSRIALGMDFTFVQFGKMFINVLVPDTFNRI